jgi:PAS domain S-box-containing protein
MKDLYLSLITEETDELIQLQETKHFLETIVSNSPDIIYILDKDGNIKFINDTIKNYGYMPKLLIGKSILDIVHPDDKEKALYKINERRTGNRKTKTLEVRLVKKNNSVIPLETNLANFKCDSLFKINAEGVYKDGKAIAKNFYGTQGIARDITVRKNMDKILQEAYGNLEHEVEKRTNELVDMNSKLLKENALRRKTEKDLMANNERYRMLFNSISDVMFVLDMDNNQFLEVNDIACDVLNYNRQDLLGKTIFDITNSTTLVDLPFFEHQKLELFLNEKFISYETEFLSRKGKAISFNVNASLFSEYGKKKILCVAQKIGRRLSKEDELRRYSEELELKIAEQQKQIKKLLGQSKNSQKN